MLILPCSLAHQNKRRMEIIRFMIRILLCACSLHAASRSTSTALSSVDLYQSGYYPRPSVFSLASPLRPSPTRPRIHSVQRWLCSLRVPSPAAAADGTAALSSLSGCDYWDAHPMVTNIGVAPPSCAFPAASQPTCASALPMSSVFPSTATQVEGRPA